MRPSILRATLASERRTLAAVFGLALLVQVISASCVTGSEALWTPNASTSIAHNLSRHGVYEGGWWRRLRGPEAEADPGFPKMFHLPGEPLYLAAGMKALPEPLHRYLHVPVTALLVTAAAWWAARFGGTRLALPAGLIGTFHPYVVLHGPVWDDTFTGAMLEWLTLGLLLVPLLPGYAKTLRGGRVALVALAVAAAGAAAVTRTASQPIVGIVTAACLLLPSLRPARLHAAAALFGMLVALGAWGARNHAVSGQFFVGTTHDGITLWESVYPSAVEAMMRRGQTERMNNERMLDDFAVTRNMGELEANAYFQKRATTYIRQNPVAVMKAAAAKTAVDLSGIDPVLPLYAPRNVVAIVANVALFALAAVGLWRGRLWSAMPRPPAVFVRCALVAATAVTFGILAVGPNSTRYWMTLQPPLWAAAACGILHLCPRRRPVAETGAPERALATQAS